MQRLARCIFVADSGGETLLEEANLLRLAIL
jgi:hypothetical protein